MKDPRSRYVNKFAKLVEETKPTAVIFENVPWMIEGPGKIFFKRYLRTLKRAGYVTFYGTVNAADFGVPQNRFRVVAISIKKRFLTKKKTEEIEKFYKNKIKKPKTVRDAIGEPKITSTRSNRQKRFVTFRKKSQCKSSENDKTRSKGWWEQDRPS
ncbi:DNA cytosine methyltransferase [Candidatus Nitrosotenuis chungbukensis]|uniref:DNA cytosine methyltransferase n=1 Tax=Candidatus Nitrosotenuis chungbukensis TaxID=1353246 RepID=UPI003B9680C1